ncbi:MAG TPA: helix-turn-helix transcriptional regulator [Bacteroidia bacterium]
MKKSAEKLIDAKAKTYKTLQLAILESGLSYEELGKKLGVHKQSINASINKKTLRLETLYNLEQILDKKIVFSQFDNFNENAEILKAKIETLEGVIKDLINKIPSKQKTK